MYFCACTKKGHSWRFLCRLGINLQMAWDCLRSQTITQLQLSYPLSWRFECFVDICLAQELLLLSSTSTSCHRQTVFCRPLRLPPPPGTAETCHYEGTAGRCTLQRRYEGRGAAEGRTSHHIVLLLFDWQRNRPSSFRRGGSGQFCG